MGFLFWFLFLARIYTAACRSNEKTVGERARERDREREKPPQLTPWDFWNAPSSLVKGGIWLACDVTCLEVWQLSKTTVALMVCSVHVHVCFFFQLFVLIWYSGMDFFNEMGFHYWAQGSTLKSKDWNYYVHIISLMTHLKTMAKVHTDWSLECCLLLFSLYLIIIINVRIIFSLGFFWTRNISEKVKNYPHIIFGVLELQTSLTSKEVNM